MNEPTSQPRLDAVVIHHWFHCLEDAGKTPVCVEEWERKARRLESLLAEANTLRAELHEIEDECQSSLWNESDPDKGWTWKQITDAALSGDWLHPEWWVGLFRPEGAPRAY